MNKRTRNFILMALATPLLLLWRGGASSITQPGGADPCTQAITATPSGLHCVTVTLAQSDLLAIAATPYTVVSAPGASKVIFPFAMRWRLQPGPMMLPYRSGANAIYLWWNNNANVFGFMDFHLSGTSGLAFPNGMITTDTAIFSAGMVPSVGSLGANPAAYTNAPMVLQPGIGDTLNRGPVLTATPNVCGTGYAVGDLVVAGPMGDAILRVATISAGGCVTSLTIVDAGMESPGGNGLAAPNEGNISSSTKNASGLGYAMGDTFTVNGGCDQATGVVDTVGGGGAVATYHLTATGDGYATTAGNATTATTGVGTGLTLNIVAASGSGLTVNLGVQAGDGTLSFTLWYTIAPE